MTPVVEAEGALRTPRPPAVLPSVPLSKSVTAKATDPRTRNVLYQKQLELEAQRHLLIQGLPHLYGLKWYPWARAFFNSTARMNLLCAANQVGKSTAQWRKCIDWATNKKKWPFLWPKRKPKIFWYLYPARGVATVEIEKKVIPELLPRGSFKDDPDYGWEVEYDKKEVVALHFKSGVTVYLKSYAQGAELLQTSSVDAVFADEEMPEELYDEINIRLAGTEGYFHMVFTATLNQDIWRRALEGEGDNELFPEAFKMQVSMYDCLFYDDGTPSTWTEARIAAVVRSCKNQTEVRRRVEGKFVTEHGRKYPSFDASRHFVKVQEIPEHWRWYSGVDIGSGGTDNHPAAITFIAVSPDNTKGFIALGWRGDGEVTTAGDVLEKYCELRGHRRVVSQRYDWHAKDFGTIAHRMGEGFEKADKTHSIGEDVLNTLFRNDMLFVFDTPELRKLGSELTSLMKHTAKSNARDDFVDSTRYGVVSIPWDWSVIRGDFDAEREERETEPRSGRPLTEAEAVAEQIRQRRGEEIKEKGGWEELGEDIAEANEAAGS